jgi:hypothetical protein
MKTILPFLMVLFLAITAIGQLAPTNPPAPRVLVAWDPNPEPDIGGYKIYHGTNSRLYNVVVDVGNVTNAVLSNFVRGVTYYFAATAYNTSSLESDFSEEVFLAIPAPPASPGGLNVTNELTVIISARLQEAEDPAGPWMSSAIDPNFYVDAVGDRPRFFKMDLGIDVTGTKPE